MVSFFKWNFQPKFVFLTFEKYISANFFFTFFFLLVSFSMTETENSWQNLLHFWSKPEIFPEVLFSQFPLFSVSFKSAISFLENNNNKKRQFLIKFPFIENLIFQWKRFYQKNHCPSKQSAIRLPPCCKGSTRWLAILFMGNQD